jgi:hypothetical protein
MDFLLVVLTFGTLFGKKDFVADPATGEGGYWACNRYVKENTSLLPICSTDAFYSV